jgi:hypothetical protein
VATERHAELVAEHARGSCALSAASRQRMLALVCYERAVAPSAAGELSDRPGPCRWMALAPPGEPERVICLGNAAGPRTCGRPCRERGCAASMWREGRLVKLWSRAGFWKGGGGGSGNPLQIPDAGSRFPDALAQGATCRVAVRANWWPGEPRMSLRSVPRRGSPWLDAVSACPCCPCPSCPWPRASPPSWRLPRPNEAVRPGWWDG